MIDVDFITGCIFVMCTEVGTFIFVFVFALELVLRITGVPADEITGACDTLTVLCWDALETCVFNG